jgi:hypothetical protein
MYERAPNIVRTAHSTQTRLLGKANIEPRDLTKVTAIIVRHM